MRLLIQTLVAAVLVLQLHQAGSLVSSKKADDTDKEDKRQPNFVFILADDLGYADVGYNGGLPNTPNIDELANGPNSIKFNYFYSGSPVCSPTRGTILTGRNHNRYCLWKANTPGRYCKSREDFACPAQVYLPTSEVTVAEILQDEGYRTAVFGKWHLGDLQQLPGGKPPSSPKENGFDAWKVTERSVPTSSPNCACFNTSLCNLGHYFRKGPPSCTNYHELNTNDDGLGSLKAHEEPILKDDSEFITDLFEDFLQNLTSAQHRKPFFAYLPFHAVHTRYVASAPYDTLYSSKDLTADEVDYYGTIAALDNAVGRIRQLLKLYNVSDNTMLWFTSDNGPAKKTPGQTGGLRERKGSIYEGGIRVPGIIEWPEINSNRVSNSPVVTSDFLPTVCDLLDISPPVDRPLDGESILPLLKHKAEYYRNASIKWAYNIRDFNGKYKAAILEDKYKLVAEYKGGRIKTAALYNIEKDKAEKKSLVLHKPDLFKRLLRELKEWRLSVIKSATQEVACL